MSKENYIEEIRPHDSAYKHVSGYAEYTDDINEPKNTIYGAIGLSKKAHAIIKNIDLTEVKKSEGVISVVTQTDIPGRNDVGPVFEGDPIFPEKKVEFFGQPLFAVAATTTELARKAVYKAKITYKDLKPVITIKEALNKKQFLFKPRKIKKGNPSKKIKNSKNNLKGNFTTGSQEHFYLEGQAAFVVPKEDDNFLVYSSTQHPSETQQLIAKMFNQKSNSINVEVRRIGGGFGGKETNFMTACICALLAKKSGQPVKLRLDRDDDIILTGKRHEFLSEYEVGFNDQGIIEGLKLNLSSNCGMSPDLSAAINERALLHVDNAYYISDIEVTNNLCKTNIPTSTAFRGFGGNQGMMAIENIIDNIARYLKKDPIEVRKKNFYQKDKRNVTHYGMTLEDNVINEIFKNLESKSNYKKRYSSIRKFNEKNKFKKKFKSEVKNLLSKLNYKNDTFVHRDFHASNLMYHNKKIAVIDSQDALIGNRAYDLASLIDDVRLKTSNELKEKVFKFYIKTNKKIDLKKFKKDFEILSVLRNLKIIGIFMRLAVRDNKRKYLKLIPYAWELINHRIKEQNEFNNLMLLLKNNFPKFIR